MIPSNSYIHESHATGEDIMKVLAAIEPAIDGFQKTHVIMACLSLTIQLMNPTLPIETITEGVKGASEWICLWISSKEPAVMGTSLVMN